VFKKPDKPLSDRDAFLGVNLTTASKDALKHEAGQQGVSMSRLANDILVDALESREDMDADQIIALGGEVE
jgi:hypothetical protein